VVAEMSQLVSVLADMLLALAVMVRVAVWLYA
jgi:hypothetical protein